MDSKVEAVGGIDRGGRIEIERNYAINDVFEKRVRAAAIAGWWSVLVGVAFVALQWIIYQLPADELGLYSLCVFVAWG